MENWAVLIAFIILLSGVFIFKKLWLGALLAILFFLTTKFVLLLQIDFVYVPLVSACIISVELLFLLFGAYLFYSTLYSNNHFESFIKTTASFSSELFTILILCLFMGSFMEGIAGFGIPAMLIAPLLLAMGFKPLTSIVLPLAANTTAVTFGALGTALKVGLVITESGQTAYLTLLLNSLPAIALPFLLAFLYSKTEQKPVQWKQHWKILLGAGFSFTVPYVVIGLFSIEYPTVVSGIAGLLIFVSIFIPKEVRPSITLWLKTFYPYFIFVVLLLIAKYFLTDFYWSIVEGGRRISLYQPGLVFILTSIIYLIIIKKEKLVSQFYEYNKETFLKTGKSIATIFLLVCLTQFIQNDLSSIVNTYYVGLHQTIKLVLNPFLGVVGSFVTGSATMSNLLLGSAIKADEAAGASLPLLLALLHTGSSIGNAISLQNIIMVKSVVNQPLIGYAKVIKYNMLVVGFYVLTIIVISLLISTVS